VFGRGLAAVVSLTRVPRPTASTLVEPCRPQKGGSLQAAWLPQPQWGHTLWYRGCSCGAMFVTMLRGGKGECLHARMPHVDVTMHSRCLVSSLSHWSPQLTRTQHLHCSLQFPQAEAQRTGWSCVSFMYQGMC